MIHDRPLFGILLMLLFCLLAPLGDALAKLLGQEIPLTQLMFVRFAVQAILLVPLVYATKSKWRMSGWVLAFAWLRIGLLIGSITCMVIALRYLPLVDTIAIVFVMPFILLLLGKIILKEVVKKLKEVEPSADAEEFQTVIFSVGKNSIYKENIREFFKLIYLVVFGQENGPRLGSFTKIYTKDKTLELFNSKLNV